MQTKPQFSANIYSFTTEILQEKLYISCSDKTAEFSHIYYKIFQKKHQRCELNFYLQANSNSLHSV